MKTLRAVIVLCLLSAASCRAQAPRVVHHLMDNLTLVERGDTVLVVRSADADTPREEIAPDGKPVVTVALFRGDSTYVLTGGKRTPMNPVMAKHLRAILGFAREESAGLRPIPR